TGHLGLGPRSAAEYPEHNGRELSLAISTGIVEAGIGEEVGGSRRSDGSFARRNSFVLACEIIKSESVLNAGNAAQKLNSASSTADLRYRSSTMSIRPVKRLIKSKPTLEGAGVHLRRAFGFGNTQDFDPFLLLDDFRNDVPEDYLAGFPWHPHRGIETITYVLAGTVQHGDSIGNSGVIGAGDVQWMTAGSGIIHQEMPKGDHIGRMHGFQLWGNLPSSLKMTSPRYQEVKAAEIPDITDDDGTHVKVVCGEFWGKKGPVEGVAADPIYLDVSVAPGRRKTLPVETTRHAFAYVFGGSGKFCNASGPLEVPTEAVKWADTTPPSEADNRSLILFDRGDEVTVQAGDDGIRFLLVSGKPLEEPVAWYGPIVMNTQEQLREAFRELEQGTFLKQKKSAG